MSSVEQAISILLAEVHSEVTLFKFAIESAKKGKRVWFMSAKPFEEIPEVEHPGNEVLSLLIFMYPTDCKDLLRRLNGMHKSKNLPNVIIVYDFSKYCPRNCSATKGCLSASFLDCLNFLVEKHKSNAVLVISCLPEVVDQFEVVRDFYFNHSLLVQNDVEEDVVKKLLDLSLLS